MDNQNQNFQYTLKKKHILFSVLFLMIVAVIGSIFVPIPYYQSYDAFCKMGFDCPEKGWHLGLSLWQRYTYTTAGIPTERSHITISSPTPTVYDQTSGWQTYRNEEFGFEVKYPAEFTVLTLEQKNARDDLPNVAESIFAIEKRNAFDGTALSTRRSFLIHVVPNVSDTQTCYTESNSGVSLKQHKTVNGENFYYSDVFGGAALGTHHFMQEYKVFKRNTCFGVGVAHVESSDWNNPGDNGIAKADKENAFEIFDQILSMFRFAD